MTDRMRVLPFESLLNWILTEYRASGSIFGIPEELFYTPTAAAPFVVDSLFGSRLATPIGPAAGPHTQLAQNIVSAWLCGGRFIELKTVQIMDELEIPRPCIDMEDEGYNVEWSQELRLSESAGEYVKAWALVCILRRLLGFERTTRFGTIFNMSVGYTLDGVQSPPMTAFLATLGDASEPLGEIREILRRGFRAFADVEIPTRVANSVTLSTMHGCPPDEIERIARHLLEEWGLHTTVKLNPTLLGKDRVVDILHNRLGFTEMEIADSVFEQDLQYDRGVELIASLKSVAAERGRSFGVKLSNTLAMGNHRGVLTGDEVYMSGRALFPVTVSLFRQLVEAFDGDLKVSYSAGADAMNVADLLAAGALPVTVTSDLLRPGGYTRFSQYLENIEAQMRAAGASSLEQLADRRMNRLSRLVERALAAPRYNKAYRPHGSPKVPSALDQFDCIEAPCIAACAIRQNVPEYARCIARGDDDEALVAILRRNPLPGVTGHVCNHRCQTRCTRTDYDEPVSIRRLKRFAAERGTASVPLGQPTRHRVAVVGSGPSGLSAAYFLAAGGVSTTIFEAKDRPGGMLAIAPGFRIPARIVADDIARIEQLGVTIERNRRIAGPPDALLDEGYDAVYVACGFPNDARVGIPGVDAVGVYRGLEFLDRVATGEALPLGPDVVIVGGGNTAMDAARTARRLTGQPATVLYRRSRAEMPALEDEVRDLVEEGNRLVELTSPLRVVTDAGRIVAVECIRNVLGPPDSEGRRTSIPIPGTEFRVEASSLVLAIGQRFDASLLNGGRLTLRKNGGIIVEDKTGRAAEAPIFAGGDAVRGPAFIVDACEDGRRAAEAICTELGVPVPTLPTPPVDLSAEELRAARRARTRKVEPRSPRVLPIAKRNGFDPVEALLTEEAARAEASRCLQCQAICDKCVDVCPNRANVAYQIEPINVVVPVLADRDGNLREIETEHVHIAQARQILHVDDLCNECGNCTTFCVHDGEPYRVKPRLFLSRTHFAAEADNALFVEKNGKTLRRREGGEELVLALRPDGLSYETPNVRLRLTSGFNLVEKERKRPFEGRVSLRPAVEMAAVLAGIRSSAPFLLAACFDDDGKER